MAGKGKEAKWQLKMLWLSFKWLLVHIEGIRDDGEMGSLLCGGVHVECVGVDKNYPTPGLTNIGKFN